MTNFILNKFVMRKILMWFMIVGIIGISSCHKPSSNGGSLTLKINPMFGSHAFVLNQVLEAPDGKYYNFGNYKFYLSHIKLVHSDGSTVEVNPVAYFSADDSRTWNVTLTNTPGSYTGIQFNIGLDPAQDTTIGNVSDSTSPYWANNFTYWGTSAMGYVFVQVDGYGDTVANPTTSNLIVYHIGTQANYTTGITMSKNFSTSTNAQTVITMNADLQKEFYNSPDTGVINILTNPVTQTSDNPALAHTFITYFPKIFSLQ